MNGCTYSCTMKCRVLACGSRSTRWRCDLWHICIAVHMQFKSPCVRLAAFYLHVRAVARVLAWLPSCSSRRSRHVRAVARQTSLVRDFVQPCNSDRLDNSHIDRPVGLFLNLVQLAHIQHVCFCSALHFGSARELASQSPTPRVRTSIACGVIVLLAMDRTQPPNNFLLVAVTL